MTYSDPSGKTVCELEDELLAVWEEHYEPYTGPDYDCEGSISTFSKMVNMFALDNFYNLHLVAKEYLSVDPVFRII
jgi:hypothetical protein